MSASSGLREGSFDYYEFMGLSQDASDAEVKAAFRDGAKKYHPDVSPLGDAEAFQKLSVAYEVLSDPDKRYLYNLQRVALRHGVAGVPGASIDAGEAAALYQMRAKARTAQHTRSRGFMAFAALLPTAFLVSQLYNARSRPPPKPDRPAVAATLDGHVGPTPKVRRGGGHSFW